MTHTTDASPGRLPTRLGAAIGRQILRQGMGSKMEGKEFERSSADGETVENLRRLANMLSMGVALELRVNGRRVRLPADSDFRVELDRDPGTGRVEVDIRWAGDQRRSAPKQEKGTPGPHIRLKALVAEPAA